MFELTISRAYHHLIFIWTNNHLTFRSKTLIVHPQHILSAKLYISQPLSLTAPCLAPNVCFVIASAAAGPTGATVNCVPPDISQVNAKLLCILSKLWNPQAILGFKILEIFSVEKLRQVGFVNSRQLWINALLSIVTNLNFATSWHPTCLNFLQCKNLPSRKAWEGNLISYLCCLNSSWTSINRFSKARDRNLLS